MQRWSLVTFHNIPFLEENLICQGGGSVVQDIVCSSRCQSEEKNKT